MTERDKNRQDSLRLVRPSREELDQWEASKAGHPWQLTLGEFLRRVASDYGYQLCETDLRVPGRELVRYLRSPDGKSTAQLPGTLRLEDPLDEFVTASLCRRLGIPPEDFGLIPEEPFEGEFDWGD